MIYTTDMVGILIQTTLSEIRESVPNYPPRPELPRLTVDAVSQSALRMGVEFIPEFNGNIA